MIADPVYEIIASTRDLSKVDVLMVNTFHGMVHFVRQGSNNYPLPAIYAIGTAVLVLIAMCVGLGMGVYLGASMGACG